MAKQKPTKPFAVKGFNITSPKGKALWCHVAEPDRQYNAKGTYSTKLVCDPDDPAVQKFISSLEELRDITFEETVESLGKVKSKGIQKADVFAEDVDAEGEPTGKIVFNFKMNNVDDREEGNDSILVVDANRTKLPKIPLVGNGSIIRCVAFANPYYMASTKSVGVSLLWTKMQLINLVEFSGDGADEFDDEDGYTAPDVDTDFDEEDNENAERDF